MYYYFEIKHLAQIYENASESLLDVEKWDGFLIVSWIEKQRIFDLLWKVLEGYRYKNFRIFLVVS